MGYSRRTSNYLNIIVLSDRAHIMSMADPVAISIVFGCHNSSKGVLNLNIMLISYIP